MPEGPEVKKIVKFFLNKNLKNVKITDISITETSRYRNKAPDNFLLFKKKLPLTVRRVCCKGKLIYFIFKPKFYMINTLGMSGYWSFKEEKHSSIKMVCRSNDKTFLLYFVDMRHFGTIKFFDLKGDLDFKLNSIGLDMLSDKTLTYEVFKKRIRKYDNKNITKVLMDQSIFSGIGNYIKSESLYRAKIHPMTDVKDLSNIELEMLFKAIRFVMNSSYKNILILQVYCKKYDPFGNKVKHMTTPDGRTTYYV